MKRQFSLFQNPQHQDLYFYGFSKQLKRKSPNHRHKGSSLQHRDNSPKSNISLPSINFHVPSYEIINNARQKKRQSALSTPKLSDRHLIDFTMKNKISKNHPFDHLSSKVDFFSTRNQKRLDIHKRKVFVDMGMVKVEKPPIYVNRKKQNGPSPEILKLLEKYIYSKEKCEANEDSLMVVGKDKDRRVNQEDEELDVDAMLGVI